MKIIILSLVFFLTACSDNNNSDTLSNQNQTNDSSSTVKRVFVNKTAKEQFVDINGKQYTLKANDGCLVLDLPAGEGFTGNRITFEVDQQEPKQDNVDDPKC